MIYSVIVTPEVLRDIDLIFGYIAEDNALAARKTITALREKIRSLKHMPTRCPLAPENDALEHAEVRHLIYGNYRILFVIRDKTVHILEIRHAARMPSRFDA